MARLFVYWSIASCSLLALPNVWAMFARLSETELVNTADIIISGRYMGEEGICFPGSDREVRVGVIVVDQVYRGETQRSRLYFPLPPAGLSRSDAIALAVGRQGIWFLVSVEAAENLYWFNHPQRLLSQAEGLLLLKKFDLLE